MKKIVLSLCLSAIAAPVFAMPCDAGYTCVSENKKISITLQSCRYKNSLKLVSVKLDNKPVTNLKLNSSFDGIPLTGKLLAFELISNDKKAPVSYLVETTGTQTPGTTTTGMLTRLKINLTEPQAPQMISNEPINCVVGG